MARIIKIVAPLTQEQIRELKSGDRVFISGVIYSFRDAAHKKLLELMSKNESLPLPLERQIVYYMGPSPARPGAVIGACGPTTSGRMDIYTPALLARGLKGMIGKGQRSPEVKEAIKSYKAVYFGAVGGAGALISRKIKKVEIMAFAELGPEAIRRLEVEDLPAVVINDSYGGDLYEEARLRYAF